jgi:DNA-binding MarR family transcriptional regulator
MEQELDPQQVHAVFEFMMFLGDTMGHQSHDFKRETLCTPEEVNVLRVISAQGPLMVKEIAQAVPGLGLSKLTRVLDALEDQHYVTRSLNREDRRSFLVSVTEEGKGLLGKFANDLEKTAQAVLLALSPEERLALVELFARIRGNWKPSQECSLSKPDP